MKSLLSLKLLVWFALCVIWGTTWMVIKIGLEDLPPIGFATARFLVAAAFLYVALRVNNIPLPNNPRDWRLLAITGVLQFSINYSLVFWGEQYITSGLAAVLQATISMFGLLLAWLVLPNERMTARKLLGVVLGIVGVAVIFQDQLRVRDTMAALGSIALIVSAYAAAQSSILVKARGSSLHPATIVFGQMICGLPPIVVYTLIVEGNPLDFHWTWRAWACIAYLAIVGTIAAFWLYYWLLERVESTKAMTISIATPLIAVLVGWVVLNEKLQLQAFVGGALVIASLGLIILRRSAR